MNKAFIFDMDGVIVDSERTWSLYEDDFNENLFGSEISKRMSIHEAIGLSLPDLYKLAVDYGFTMPREEFYRQYDERAKFIYQEAMISHGLEELLTYLRKNDFKAGLVSASPKLWIDWVLDKSQSTEKFDYILSLHERDDLGHKPSPDGYIEAIKMLESSPQTTIVLEDSNRGIQSGKASGAFTIGFTQHLLPDYTQHGADVYANSLQEVIHIIEKCIEKM